MEESLRAEWKAHLGEGRLARHFHKMGPLQWDYNRDIARLGDVPEIRTCVARLYHAVHERRQHHLMDYKRDDYTLRGQDYVRVEKEQGR